MGGSFNFSTMVRLRPVGPRLSVLVKIAGMVLLVVLFAGAGFIQAVDARGDAAFSAAGSVDSVVGRALSVSEVREEEEGASVPRHVGDTVLVRGRTCLETGVIARSERVVIQDGTGGIVVDLPPEAAVERGDSLVVKGVVHDQAGRTVLDAVGYSRFEADGPPLKPLPVTVTVADGGEYDGRLVRIDGRVVANRKNERGRYLVLEDVSQTTDARVAAFVPTDRLDQVSLDAYKTGTQVQVTGPLLPAKTSGSTDVRSEILPRDAQDINRARVISLYNRTAIVFLIAIALIAAVAVFTLRVAVKQRTQELEESKRRFRRLAEATFEGIIVHRDGKILDVNRTLTEMVGYDRETLVGRAFTDVLSDATRDFVQKRHAPSNREAPYEAVMVQKDGSTFPVEIEEREVETSDESVRVAALRDITERKQREAEILLAKQEAEQMAQLRSSLLNNMSHELRTPITSIIGYAELIMEEAGADCESFGQRIRQSGKRLSRTVRAVLEMAKIESDSLDVQPQEVDMKILVEEVVEKYQSTVDKKGLLIDTSSVESCTLYTDRVLVYRILSNLFHNAIKFTEQGRVQIEINLADPGVQIIVSDTGVGIDPDFQTRIFEPFQQESEGRSRTHDGMGLGLALTKRMVELLEGTIDVESVKEEGSTFVVELPPVLSADGAMSGVVEATDYDHATSEQAVEEGADL